MAYKKQSAIIFDLDDVLISTSSAILLRLSLLFKKYPIREGMFYIYHLLANPERESILASKYNFSKEFLEDYEKLRSVIRPRPIGDIKGKLESLSQEDFELGILTNSPLRKINEFIVSSSIDYSIFKIGIYSSETLPYLKPNPKCFSAIKNLDSYKEVFYVGDNIHDFHIARENCINFKGVCTGLANRSDFIYVGVKTKDIFPSIQEVTFYGKN